MDCTMAASQWESAKQSQPPPRQTTLTGGRSTLKESWLRRDNPHWWLCWERQTVSGQLLFWPHLAGVINDAWDWLIWCPEEEMDGWMTFMWHWAGSPHWVTDYCCVGAGVSLSSTWLDRTPTASRAAVAVGVGVEVTGVGLSHRQWGFNPNLTAGGIPPLVTLPTWVQRWEHTPLCFQPSNRREARCTLRT